jgi:mono/diheme cytochrome c family protein
MLVITTFGIFATADAQNGDATRGAKLFAQNCAVCHGDHGQGRVGATLAKDFPGIRVDLLLKDTISTGVKGSVMPAWAKANGGPLTDAEIDDLVAFVRSLGNIGPTVVPITLPPTRPATAPTPVATFPPGDSTRGAQIFTTNCAVCHGANGEGRIGATLEKDWAGINVTALLDTTIARGVAGSKMPAWAQTNGGPLTNQDIADAAAYVVTLKKTGQPAPTPAAPLPQGGDTGGVLALVCVGIVVLIGVVVLILGLTMSRAKQ